MRKIALFTLLFLIIASPILAADFRVQNDSGDRVNFLIIYGNEVIADGYVSGLTGIDITNGPDAGLFTLVIHGVGVGSEVVDSLPVAPNQRLVIFIDEWAKVHVFPITRM